MASVRSSVVACRARAGVRRPPALLTTAISSDAATAAGMRQRLGRRSSCAAAEHGLGPGPRSSCAGHRPPEPGCAPARGPADDHQLPAAGGRADGALGGRRGRSTAAPARRWEPGQGNDNCCTERREEPERGWRSVACLSSGRWPAERTARPCARANRNPYVIARPSVAAYLDLQLRARPTTAAARAPARPRSGSCRRLEPPSETSDGPQRRASRCRRKTGTHPTPSRRAPQLRAAAGATCFQQRSSAQQRSRMKQQHVGGALSPAPGAACAAAAATTTPPAPISPASTIRMASVIPVFPCLTALQPNPACVRLSPGSSEARVAQRDRAC